jgi:hypothetical protein
MGGLFVLFTYWQFNDLEQYETEWWQGWVLTYALCSVVSLVSWWKALPRWFYLSVSIVTLAVAAYWSLGIEWHKTVLYNETNPSGNESGGLFIIAVWFGVLACKHKSLGCACKKTGS